MSPDDTTERRPPSLGRLLRLLKLTLGIVATLLTIGRMLGLL